MTAPGPRWWMGGAAALAVSGVSGPQPETPAADVVAWIAEEEAGSGLVFVAYVRAREGLSGRYELLATRGGPSGTSTVRQGGAVQAGPGAVTRLSQVALGADRRDHRHEVVLRVLDGDVLLAQDRLTR